MTCPPPSGLGPCAAAEPVGTSNTVSRSNRVKILNVILIDYTPRGTLTNRHIDTDHKRPIPANAEISTIKAKGERNPGSIRKRTEPACASACMVVIKKIAHWITAAIQVAGAAKNETR